MTYPVGFPLGRSHRSVGSGATLPDGLEIPIPDGGDVMASFTSDGLINVSLSYDQGRFDEIVGFYENWTSGTGEEWDAQTMSLDSGEGTLRTNLWAESAGNSKSRVVPG